MNKIYNQNEILFSLHIPKSGGTSFREALIFWFTKSNQKFFDIEKRPNIQIKARWFLERGIPQTLFGDNLFLHYKNHIKNDIPNLVYKEKWLNTFSNQPKCIHGHFNVSIDNKSLFDFYPRANQFIAFIRSPLELHLSMFYYHQKLSQSGGVIFRGIKEKSKILDVDEWLENHNSNMLNFFPFNFTHDNYRDILNNNFIHIGITEEMNISLDILSEKLSRPKVKIPFLNTAERFKHPSTSAIRVFEEKHSLEFEIYNYVKLYNRL